MRPSRGTALPDDREPQPERREAVIVAVVFALEAEFRPWRARRDFRRAGSGRPAIYEAAVGSSRVRAAVCGVGARTLTDATARLFAGADAVAVAGLAGALRSDYAIGDVLVARRVRRAGSEDTVACAPALVSVASQCGSRVVDSFLTAERIISRADEKRRLGEHDAVEMESYPVLREAGRSGIPGIAIRVVGDSVDEDLPFDFTAAIRDDGTIRRSAMLRQVLASPRRWPMLVRFGAEQQRALTALAAFLDRFVVAFVER
jgi:nucleoside phosphorylase